MQKFISGKEAIEKLNIRDFQLLDHVKKSRLQHISQPNPEVSTTRPRLKKIPGIIRMPGNASSGRSWVAHFEKFLQDGVEVKRLKKSYINPIKSKCQSGIPDFLGSKNLRWYLCGNLGSSRV